MTERAAEIMRHIKEHPILNTHSHHLGDESFGEFDLDALLRQTYVNWSGVAAGDTRQSREAYLDQVRYKSYFVWLEKSLRQLYGFDGPLTPDNWEEISRMIRDRYADKNFQLDVLRRRCRYEKVILDSYWNPGGDNGHPNLFTPAFRVDPFFCGYAPGVRDHDGNSPASLYGEVPADMDGYFEFLHRLIQEKKRQGCVALKCAIAYDRGLGFEVETKDRAARVFSLKASDQTKQDIAAFQNYLFQWVCETAAETGLPLQCHTGMGQLTDTRAMALKGAVERNPDTKFVLFHCSYPWMGDVNALMHVYPNVYPDLCWLPILSPTAAKRQIHELIEVGTSGKVCWGCDTWTSEESYGALLAFESVFSCVLEEKVKEGYFTLKDAMQVADKVMYENAAALYRL